ncbi:MAG: hypothetical protein A3J79_06785 [Elusimicrobia bacterium RIFOXYB2_FULL_62_6]|nr:MAG: hypothetical protein A3J79_06785 [Elusimicrobia bacterium RIFOXYB2_FULL_62_6]
MKNLLNVIVCVCVLGGQAYAARLQASNFRYKAAVTAKIVGGTLYRVDLPAAVLLNCAPGQPDIRLFSPAGEEIQFTLVKGEYLKKADELYAPKITAYRADSREAVLEFALESRPNPVTSLELSVEDTDFRKDTELSGSDDGKSWKPLGRGSVYDFSSQVDLRKTLLEFPRSTYRFYRLKLRDTEEPAPQGKTVSFKYDGIDLNVGGGKGKKLRINGVSLRTGGRDTRVEIYDEKIFQPAASGELKDNQSFIAISQGLPFEKVEFDLADSFFMRDLTAYYSETGEENSYRRLSSASIYRFPPGWPAGERAWAEISSPGYRYYRFVFNNKNNPPLRIKSVKLKWLRRSLYFIAPGDMTGATVSFGRPGTERPAYDVESFVNQDNWEKRTQDALQLGEPVLTEGYSPELPADRKTRTEKNLLTAIIVLVTAGMGYWLYNLLKKAGPAAN